MNKFSLLVIVLFAEFPFLSFAQTNTFPFPASGSVGIGTTNPQSTLDVRGDAKIGATLVSSSNSPFSGSAIFTSSAGYHNIFGVDGAWTSKYFGIKTNGDFITAGGKFGIGTSTPAQNFVVSSNNQDGFEVYLNQPMGTVGLQSFNRTTSSYGVMRFDAIQYFFPGGNLGIGTTSPSAILHVNPQLDATSAIKIGAPNTSGNINVPLKASTGGYNIDFYTWRDVQIDQIGARIRAERINDFVANNALVQAMDLTFSTSTGYDAGSLSEKMRINSLGNVGIGTAVPKEKLSVNGKIRAHEVKVETANWPDFVFTKDYILPTLQETEKHIKEKGHLPDIPSAAEVEKNGIELGEMNKKLLQKIEELTLYLIEQSREISELKKEVYKSKKD